MSTFNWDIDSWKVLDLYFSDDSRLVQHQLESFNDYIDVLIPQIIERNNPILINTDYDKDIDMMIVMMIVAIMHQGWSTISQHNY